MWNRLAAFILFVYGISLFAPVDIEARGGRGGGGGGRGGGGARGGAYRGGHSMNRTPSMSRATSRPAARQSRPISQTRTLQSQRPTAANKAQLRNQVNQFAQNRPMQQINPQIQSQRAQNFSSNRVNQLSQNRQLSQNVSQRLQQSRPNYNNMFNRNFFDRHNIAPDYLGRRDNFWRPAAWATLASWGNWGWSTPYYYDYGGYVYPVTNVDYSYPATPSTPSYQPTQTVQTTTTADSDWLPLGVFAVASNANTAAGSNRFIQLALKRNGEIAGVLYNSLTDNAQDLVGMVDPNSQKAYWSLTNRTDSPVASTGIYNLTEDQTPINVRFSDGSEQTWTLVRLQQENNSSQ